MTEESTDKPAEETAETPTSPEATEVPADETVQSEAAVEPEAPTKDTKPIKPNSKSLCGRCKNFNGGACPIFTDLLEIQGVKAADLVVADCPPGYEQA